MIKPIKKFTSFRRENAQTMVEFAIVFPIVLLLTYGIIEFGRMVFVYAAVTGAAREGARYGAASAIVVDKLGNKVPQYANCGGIRDAVRSKAFLTNIPDGDIHISYDKGPGLSWVATTCEILANDVYLDKNPIKLGDRTIVRVRVQFTPWIAFLGVHPFDIISQNSRTILSKIEIATPTP